MAYFSNGSEGAILDNQCAECPLGEKPCPIALAQQLFNYKQIDKNGERNVASEVLDTLINEHGICQMKPLFVGMTPPEPERVYDPMSPELKEWAVARGLAVKEAARG